MPKDPSAASDWLKGKDTPKPEPETPKQKRDNRVLLSLAVGLIAFALMGSVLKLDILFALLGSLGIAVGLYVVLRK